MVANWACDHEVTEILTQSNITVYIELLKSDLKSPTSNHIPDIATAFSVVYDTCNVKNKTFSRMCFHIVYILHLSCDIKLCVLVL